MRRYSTTEMLFKVQQCQNSTIRQNCIHFVTIVSLPLPIQETMVSIVRKMQLFYLLFTSTIFGHACLQIKDIIFLSRKVMLHLRCVERKTESSEIV